VGWIGGPAGHIPYLFFTGFGGKAPLYRNMMIVLGRRGLDRVCPTELIGIGFAAVMRTVDEEWLERGGD